MSGERSDVAEARKAYAHCVAQYSASAAECVALQQRVHAAEQRYEDNARRAWGCDPAQTECPTPR